jgi:hypothetical protein
MVARAINTSAAATIASTSARRTDTPRENAPCRKALRLPLGAPLPLLGPRLAVALTTPTMNCSSESELFTSRTGLKILISRTMRSVEI